MDRWVINGNGEVSKSMLDSGPAPAQVKDSRCGSESGAFCILDLLVLKERLRLSKPIGIGPDFFEQVSIRGSVFSFGVICHKVLGVERTSGALRRGLRGTAIFSLSVRMIRT